MAWPENRFDTFLKQGLDEFNTGRFWHAHEAWETIWLESGDPDLRRFLQGLIQIAAAYHHVQRGTIRGAVRLFDAGVLKLRNSPEGLCRVDVTSLIDKSLQHRAWADSRLREAAGEATPSQESRMPPFPTIDLPIAD